MILTKKLIGSGANGLVFLTYRYNEKFATKMPVSKREHYIAEKLSGVVGPKVYNEELENHSGSDYMIMEYLGDTENYLPVTEELCDLLEEYVEIEDELAMKLIEKIKLMHSMGFAHNDLCASNILVKKGMDGEYYDFVILDFGKSGKITQQAKIDDFQYLIESIDCFSSKNHENVIALLKQEIAKL